MTTEDAAKRRKGYINSVIGGYRIIQDCSRPKRNEPARFLVECCSCGHRSVKGLQELRRKKSNKCSYCPPEYQFDVEDGIAQCTLPDGSTLIIDEEDINKIKDYFWWDNGVGYVLTKDKATNEKIQIHRLILGLSKDSPLSVDHINRNKHDNRKSNLRVVTQHQNSMNNPKKKNNTTGYTGVWFDKNSQKYCAKIMFNYNGISLGRSQDPVVCAQMYNIAARMLFGDYRGYTNDVPKPSAELIEKIKLKCQPYMDEAYQATRKCGLSFCAREGR